MWQHTPDMVLEFVHETFGDAVMPYHFPQYHRFGPTCLLYSSSINPCNCLKEKLSVKDPGTVLELMVLITELCCPFSEGLCQKCNIGCIEHIVHYKQFSIHLC